MFYFCKERRYRCWNQLVSSAKQLVYKDRNGGLHRPFGPCMPGLMTSSVRRNSRKEPLHPR